MIFNKACMTVWEKFCVLGDEAQVDFVENNAEHTIHVFPMSEFDAFFKEFQRDQYRKIIDAAWDGMEAGEFDPHDLWCEWDETDGVLRSGETPADFVDDQEELAGVLIRDSMAMKLLGFSDKKAEALRDQYEREEAPV